MVHLRRFRSIRFIRAGQCCWALALIALSLAACDHPKVDVSWHDESGYSWRALDVPARGHAGFKPMASSATGVTHRNDVSDEHALANRNLLIGAGVAAGDIDGDGLPDLFLASVEQPAALYHNEGGFRFTDITPASGIDTRGLATVSAAFADVNGDGNLDLVVGTLGGPLKLWAGNGKGQFEDVTDSSGFPAGLAATAVTLADVDGDGDLDLYVGTYKTRNALDAYPPQARAFDQIVRKVGDKFVVAQQWQKEYRVEDHPELGGLVRSQRAEPDVFLVNDGTGKFTRVAMTSARFTDENGKPLRAEPDYFTLAARFYDVNGDGAPDLYVCNDFEDPDQFWLNDGKGNFRLVPPLAVRETSNTCMSVDFGDIDRDGHVDFFTADMLGSTLADRQRHIATNTPMPKQGGLARDRQQWMRNALLLSRGDGTWASIADFAGVSGTDWTWGSAFVDIDLDGYEDLVALNGHRWDVRDADTFQRLQHSVSRVAWNREQGEFPRSATRSFAFRNNHDATFSDRSRDWGIGTDAAISQGIALADLDGDGDQDLIATRLDDTPVLYRNESVAPRIEIELVGADAARNRNGIGARVTVRGSTLPVQTREVTAGGYYLSGSAPALTFAAGSDTVVGIEVRWRSGAVSRVDGARPNRLYRLREPRLTADSSQLTAQGLSSTAQNLQTKALFEDATRLLHGHTHVDSLFDDYRRQPLLPNKFSQLGPGVTWTDVDADGRADLVVGAGRGGKVALFRNTGRQGDARFASSSPPGSASAADLTALVPVPDAKRGMLLVAGQMNYETSSPAEALALPSLVGFPRERGALGHSIDVMIGDSASVGPLALGDVNGDGRLDLFVGARVVPGAWPVRASSHLWLRQPDGTWAPDAVNASVVSVLGLVSAALFTDLDGDGWPELVTTAEWGPVRVFHNERGKLRDVTREWGLSGITSRWNGLAAGDFDGDGKLDLVATSWGRNTPWQASDTRPYALLVGNFGGRGLGLLFARRDSVTGREMPLASFEKAVLAIPSARDRIATFADYSTSSVDVVLGDRQQAAIRVGATTFDHVVLLNRGGRFEARALPAFAQLAPAFAPVVADFDGDGKEDLFLAQNFSPTEGDTPRFDAGAGLVLLGDGQGNFEPLSTARSGIRILGDQRGAAVSDYDGDGRVDLAVSQNGAATTLWHNRDAKPGIRLRVNGGRDNPFGIGAQLRIGNGPVREIRAGSGYWSVDDPVTVLALPAKAKDVWIRWPTSGRGEQRLPITAGRREMSIMSP